MVKLIHVMLQMLVLHIVEDLLFVMFDVCLMASSDEGWIEAVKLTTLLYRS